jgi:hypothetical protein
MAKQSAGKKTNPYVQRAPNTKPPIKKPLPPRPTDHTQRGTND